MTESIQEMLAPLNCGKLNLNPYAVIDGQIRTGNVTECAANPETGRIRLQIELAGVFQDTLSFQFRGDQIRCHREFRNISGAVMKLNELGAALEGIDFE